MLQCPWSGTVGRQPKPPAVPPVQQQPNSQHGTEPSLHWKTNGDQQSEQRHRQSSAALSYITPHQWPAARTSTVRLRSETRRPRHPHRCWTSTGCKHMRASPVTLRSASWCKRTAWSVVQRGNCRSARHHSLNDLVWQAMTKADIPALKEPSRPSGLLRTDGKRPDGVTLLPRKQGKCATWDGQYTLVQSYVHETSWTLGASAEAAAERKRNKYSSLSQSYLFVPFAQKRLGPSAKTGWTYCANLEGVSHIVQMATPSPTQPPRTKCSRSSILS